MGSMTETIIECPNCGNERFNYCKRRTIEKIELRLKNGVLKPCDSGVASPKMPVASVVCQYCHSEYDEDELLEELESMGFL